MFLFNVGVSGILIKRSDSIATAYSFSSVGVVLEVFEVILISLVIVIISG